MSSKSNVTKTGFVVTEHILNTMSDALCFSLAVLTAKTSEEVVSVIQSVKWMQDDLELKDLHFIYVPFGATVLINSMSYPLHPDSFWPDSAEWRDELDYDTPISEHGEQPISIWEEESVVHFISQVMKSK